MIENKFLHYKTETEFKKDLEGGVVKDSSIALIQDKHLIWSHGEYYKCIPEGGGVMHS